VLRRPASSPALAGEGGPGVGGVFACPGGVSLCPRSFFACPGGIFACWGGVTETGGLRSKAAGNCVGRGDGSGLTGTVATGGGDETGTCLRWPVPAAGVGRTATCATGAIGVATATGSGEVVRPEVWWLALGTAGA
jgi:hypothetical protein